LAEHDTRPDQARVQKGTAANGRRGLLSRVQKERIVLTTLLVVLVLLWLLGIGTSYTLGGFIHILLVIAIIVVLVRVIQGRNPLRG
jgi:Family of unknown function (DUF5670)